MQINNHFVVRFVVLGLCVWFLGCDQVDQQSSVSFKCQPATGNAFEDGQVEVCMYETDSIEKAYQTIVNQHQHDTSGYQLLRKSLPVKQTKDDFEDQSVWISYSGMASDSAVIKLQMAGGEDELLIKKQNGKVLVQTTLSAD
jgi:hypothetical protein